MDAFLMRVDEFMGQDPKPFKSERDWCRKAGIDESYIAVARNRGGKGTGEVHDVKSEKVAALARAAKLDTSWLLGADLHTVQAPQMSRSTLSEAIEAFEWPPDLLPTQAVEVVARARAEAEGLAEGLPVRFWAGRLTKLAQEVREAPSARSRVRKTTAASK